MFPLNNVFTKRHFIRLVHYSTTTSIPVLRKYQNECIENSLKELKAGCFRQVVSLPVGSGKTVIMSNFIPRIPNPTPKATKVLLLAHRQELLNQAYNQIKRFNPELVVGIDQGKRIANYDEADVIVASVPTLGRPSTKRIDSLDPSLFKAILIDEAHHAVANSYLNIIDHFHGYQPLIWGCSATVRRHDGMSLSDVFDKITYHMDFLELIEQRHLSPMKVTTVRTSIDLSGVRSQGGDFALGQLSRVVNTPVRNEVIVSSWKKFAQEGRKSTLVFAVDIKHTQDLCNMFREQGIAADFVTSKTPDMTRHQILEDFRSQKIPVLINCGKIYIYIYINKVVAILTEGTDIPSVDCILMARPTRSATLFQQMFGRGLRLYEGKEDCLLVDFVDNFKKGGTAQLVTIPTLLGLKADENLKDENILNLEKRAMIEEQEELATGVTEDESHVKIQVTEYDTLEELMADLSTSVEVENASRNNWVNVGYNKYVLHVLTKGYFILEEYKGMWKGSFKYEGKTYYGKPYNIPLTCDQLSDAVRAADTWIQKKFTGGYIFRALLRNVPFRKLEMTEAQRKLLNKHNVTAPKLNRGQAKDLLTKIKFGQLSVWRGQLKMKEKARKERETKNQAAYLRRVKKDES
ncbi:unnamed protein product [Rhizopus stolonifer]